MSNVCGGVQLGDTITFNVNVTVINCDSPKREFRFAINPSGLTENVTITLTKLCDCDCSKPGGPVSKCTDHSILHKEICNIHSIFRATWYDQENAAAVVILPADCANARQDSLVVIANAICQNCPLKDRQQRSWICFAGRK